MTDVSKVSQWVRKAVADIAAFEGKLRRVDTESEKKALSTLLAGNLSDEDKDYIEGFMLDRRRRSEKIDGKKPEKNESRTVEVSLENEAFSGPDNDYLQKFKDMRQTAKLFFDDKGNLIKDEVKGKDGEITAIRNIQYVSEDEVIYTMEEKMPDGSINSFKFAGIPTKEEPPKMLDMVVRSKDGDIVVESHITENGAIRRGIVRGVDAAMQDMNLPEDMHENTSFISSYEEICQDGVATFRFLDQNGKEIYKTVGTYEIDEHGFFLTKYLAELRQKAGVGSPINVSEIKKPPENGE